ncbi:hypothetical protein OQJ13_03545 [Legionella sp. PATHC035]|uniref:hypothetical protein n=1 Tax=Legionella sp. PATHC035 TaxID=2992040 RepID=UPI0022438A9F|nr:hypothetical protein [Legionella sp. PATHC035]MCW8408041.1 hypothetical protein [Legionella sp. PATHC035]
MIGKSEILLKLSDYQKSVLNLKQNCDQLTLHFEMNTERFFTPIPIDEHSKLRLEHESLKLKVAPFLGKKDQSDQEQRKEINFFSKAP